MKKLMVAFAVVAMAVAAHASAYTWKANSGYVFNTDGSTYASGTAYIFNADAYSQATLLTALYAAEAADAGALATAFATIANQNAITHQEMSAGKIALGAEFTYNKVAADSSWSAYYAMIVDDNIYISSQKDNIVASALADPVAISMGSQSTVSKNVFGEFGTEYSTAGWYAATQSVPEPTSALMLLLGMAGLALRRKQA